MPSLMKMMLEMDHQHVPMGIKHEVLGEASFFLDMVLHTGRIPGMSQYQITPTMQHWCYHKPEEGMEVKACLGGIWYMASTNELLDVDYSLDTMNILLYLESVATCTMGQLHEMVGMPERFFSSPHYDGWVIYNVQDRLHTLAEHIPAIRESYLATAKRMWYPTGVPGGLVIEPTGGSDEG